MNEILQRIETLRNQQNISKYKLCKELNLAQSTYNTWLQENRIPKTDKLQKIANYFNVTIDYLSTGKEKEWKPTLSEKERIDIGHDVQATLNALDSKTGLMFDGEILDEETKEYLESALKTAFTNAKIMAKEKYTPNKYRK